MNGDGNSYGPATLTESSRLIQGNVGRIINHNYYDSKEVRSEEDWRLLLTSLCYESMNDRKHQIHSAAEDTCEWIWTTVFARWLRVKSAKIFWISGKPGSGKSTLMKYLSHSPRVRQNLPGEPGSWTVIDFFFDYRLAEKTGNTIEGLLRSLISQIVSRFPDITEILNRDAHLIPGTTLQGLERRLQLAVSKVQHCFLILIDGLDEFSAGRLTYLAEFLLKLKGFQRVKLCLASRPEAAIQPVFEGISQIAMSDYNLAGIDQYINAVIERWQPSLDLLSEPVIKELIVHQSDGVFLWVHLVLDELVISCAEGATLSDLQDKINMLPTELELLYERILERIPLVRQAEAAAIFTLIDTAAMPITLSLLRDTMFFLASEMSIASLPSNLTNSEHFQRRLHGTMRGLVDINKGWDERCIDESQKYPTVRLIHRTLRSYAERNTWFQQHLPPPLQQIGSSWLWTHLCSKSLLETGRFIDDPAQFELLYTSDTIRDYQSFAQSIVRISKQKSVEHWLALLFHGVLYITTYAENAAEHGSRALKALTATALRSPINYVHYTLCAWHSKGALRRIPEILDQDITDLVLAAAHDAYQYILDKKSRIADLTDDQRRELASVVIFTSSRRQRCPAQCYFVSSLEMRYVVDSILSFDTRLTSFHVGIYLLLGYGEAPQFLSKALLQDQYCHSEIPTIPSWFVAQPLFAAEPPLFIWACEYDIPRGLTAEAQLRTLASFDFDINCKSSAGYNIVHYIITRHIIGHTFLEEKNDCQCCPEDGDDIADAVTKLYVVEEFGADFTMQYEHRTPLQAFRHGVDLIRQATFLAQEVPEARFKHFDFMLQHKEQVGHLPQPMLGESRWRKHQIPLLLERKCDICTAASVVVDTPRTGMRQVVNERASALPSRPSPSRIPRLKRTNMYGQSTKDKNNNAL